MERISRDIRRERVFAGNIRYIGYSLLKDVRYNDEPVVPRILSEGEDSLGKCFYVEQMPGDDLTGFMKDERAPLRIKLLSLADASGQLAKIDEAGFVLFDRALRNMTISGFTYEKVNLRQIDIEEIYDKSTQTHFASPNAHHSQEDLDFGVENNLNIWTDAIRTIADQSAFALYFGNKIEMCSTLLPFTKEEVTTNRNLNFYNLEEVLRKIVSKL